MGGETPMTKDVLHTIGERLPQFSKGQKRIADYILSDYDKAAFMTASRLGSITGVSESTVVRFAATLGYDGYPAMQKALQEIVRSKLTSIQRIEASDDLFGSDVVASVLQRDMDQIRVAIEEMDRAAFNAAVEKLTKARHIYILGVRSSSFLAGYLHFYLHLIFDNVTLVTSNSAGDILESILRIGPGDVLLGISFPRYSQSTVKGVQFAYDRGADVVAVTDSDVSPLYPLSSVALLARSDMISFVDSLVAPFSLFNALIVAAGHRKNADIAKTFHRLEDIWEEYGVFGPSNEK
jgi:DNA-binding MurR/RpiR family transcriptional regulator